MRPPLFILLLLGLPLALSAQQYTDYLGNGHTQGIAVRSSSTTAAQNAYQTINGFPASEAYLLGDVSRFLSQASFGGDWAEIERVSQIGYEAWIEEQLGMEPTLVGQALAGFKREAEEAFLAQFGDEDEEDDEVEEEEEEEEEEEFEEFFVNFQQFREAWFHTAMMAPDQLRQRVAFALSEMMVISDVPDDLEDSGDGLTNYYDILVRHGLGNYRDLLLEVTLHPSMGYYLSHLNNPRSDTSQNIHPDENYAREVMQLFSIGLYELNQDGSHKLDSLGVPIPTYSNADIKEFAKIFTGLGGATSPEATDDPEDQAFFGLDFYSISHIDPMIMYEDEHEPGPKYLLNGQLVPAGQSGRKDIEDAIDNLYNHPNVGPFMARHLIQRLVTSNPTPDYIQRVASVFANNGRGERGDMGAVVKAVLMDEAARACNDREGNLFRASLREPILRYLHFCRALELSLPEGEVYFRNPMNRLDEATGQAPLSASSVFNFFLPDYQPNGLIADLDLFGPEFQIHNSTTAIQYINEVEFWTTEVSPMEIELEFEDVETEEEEEALYQAALSRIPVLQIDPLMLLASQATDLLDRLNILLVRGQLSAASYQTILDAIQQIDELETRLEMAVFLIMISPDYNILN
ncbi:MAG: DUF1800 family protein [Bacteroidota bacterium]